MRFEDLTPELRQKAMDIANVLNRKNSTVYKIDPLTILMIIQVIIKIIQWFIEWRRSSVKDLNFFHKALLWAAVVRYAKIGTAMEVVNATLDNLDDEFIKQCSYNKEYVKGINPDEITNG